MSTTTTTTTATTTAIPSSGQLRSRGYPADYDLHHSHTPSSSSEAQAQARAQVDNVTTATQSSGSRRQRNPRDWPNDYRRIPPYRPINRNLDQSQRRVYTSVGERMFLTTMFTGLEVNVVVNRIWKTTGGRITKNVFAYKIGGEY